MNPDPFFILGSQRSGTTLLRSMLARHPRIAFPPESHLIPALWSRRRRYGTGDQVEDIDRFVADLAQMRGFALWQLEIELVRARLEAKPAWELGAAVNEVFLAYAGARGKSGWAEKAANYLRDVPVLVDLFPNCRVIHIVRDGRDVALSMIEVGRRHEHAATAAYFWRRSIRLGDRARVQLPANRYQECSYERLVSDPARELETLCEFLRLEFVEALVHHDPDALETVPAQYRGLHGRLAMPPTAGLRDWETQLATNEREEFEAIAGDELASRGYPVGPPPPVARRLRAWLRILRFAMTWGTRRVRDRLRLVSRRASERA